MEIVTVNIIIYVLCFVVCCFAKLTYEWWTTELTKSSYRGYESQRASHSLTLIHISHISVMVFVSHHHGTSAQLMIPSQKLDRISSASLSLYHNSEFRSIQLWSEEEKNPISFNCYAVQNVVITWKWFSKKVSEICVEMMTIGPNIFMAFIFAIRYGIVDFRITVMVFFIHLLCVRYTVVFHWHFNYWLSIQILILFNSCLQFIIWVCTVY